MIPSRVPRVMLPLLLLVLARAAGAAGQAGDAGGTDAPPPLPPGNPATGAHLYGACMGCHSLDDNDVGPRHRGVVGRAAGAVPGYAYSAALKGSGIVWTPDNLDRWLSGPQKMVPGAKMYFSIAKPQDRADIIAYLAQQK